MHREKERSHSIAGRFTGKDKGELCVAMFSKMHVNDDKNLFSVQRNKLAVVGTTMTNATFSYAENNHWMGMGTEMRILRLVH